MRQIDLMNQCRPSDFNTKHYEGVHVFNKRNGSPVIVMRSKKPNANHWCVVCGFESTYYTTYNSAIEYCKNRKWIK